MSAVGASVATAIEASPASAAIGGLGGKTLEPLADWGLDLLDTYVLDGILKGWTPRVFQRCQNRNHQVGSA
jgi:hypothetical protein